MVEKGGSKSFAKNGINKGKQWVVEVLNYVSENVPAFNDVFDKVNNIYFLLHNYFYLGDFLQIRFSGTLLFNTVRLSDGQGVQSSHSRIPNWLQRT